MRQTIIEWTSSAYSTLLPFAELALIVALVVVVPLSLIKSTRPAAGVALFLLSYVIGITTWLLGAAVTFASFGWIGLFIGLVLFGVGVVALGAIGSVVVVEQTWIAVTLVIGTALTYGLRLAGLSLADR